MKQTNLTKHWDRVNNAAGNLEEIVACERDLYADQELSNEEFDELMRALSYLKREAYSMKK